MGTNKQENVLFQEINFASSDKIMVLNKPRLLEMIEAVYKSESLPALRENVFKLKEQLSNSKVDKERLFNIETNGDTVRINQRYLSGELKQIVEAQTLQRSKYYLKRLAKAISEQRTNKINDLDLNRWKQYSDIITDSLWILKKRDNTADAGENHVGQGKNRRYGKH